MITSGPAKKLTVYVDEKARHHKKPVYEAIVDLLFENKVVGASVFRGVTGYGTDGILHTSKMLELSTDLPVKIEAVDSEAKINEVLPEIYRIVEKGLIEVSDTQIVKCCGGTESEADR